MSASQKQKKKINFMKLIIKLLCFMYESVKRSNLFEKKGMRE